MKKQVTYQLVLIAFLLFNFLLLGFNEYIRISTLQSNPFIFGTSLYFTSVALVINFILNGLLPRDFKFMIISCKWKNYYPTFKLETLIKQDMRFDKEQFEKNFGRIPEDVKEKNIYWYQNIYKKVQDVEKVKTVHRDFLLSRDIAVICFFTIIISVINTILFEGALWHIPLLLMEFLILKTVSINYANRFITTAISEAL